MCFGSGGLEVGGIVLSINIVSGLRESLSKRRSRQTDGSTNSTPCLR